MEARGSDWVVLRVGGMSYKVYAPTSTLGLLGTPGEEVHLHTHLVVREDNLALYGFVTIEELEAFELLIGVNGVGPKAALAMLSVMKPGQLSQAIASGDIDMLTRIPGVGKKMAGRLVVELKGKLDQILAVPVPATRETDADVVAALRALGYTTAEAASAVASIPSSDDLSLEEKVRLALQQFGSR